MENYNLVYVLGKKMVDMFNDSMIVTYRNNDTDNETNNRYVSLSEQINILWNMYKQNPE
jgi:hypothetical protein